jgi:hypothetical protein
MFVDRVTSHCCRITRKFLDGNKDTIKLEHLPVGSPNLIQHKIAGGPENTSYFLVIILALII